MIPSCDIHAFLDRPGVFIDVRSPCEFSQGHIPGAFNLPLFSNEERALVGTTYKKKGQNAALIQGLEIAGPKLSDLAIQAKQIAGKNFAKVYCWRGGQRSRSMAWLFQTAGLQTCTLLMGYKAFRRWTLNTLSSPRLIFLIGGLTGTGKTKLLRQLKEEGKQILDLEALAHHRGSSFGLLEKHLQPANEHFENRIAFHLSSCNSALPLWIEDESRMIGKCKIPDPLFAQMRQAPLFILESQRNNRIQHILEDYGNASLAHLAAATQRIERRLGSEKTKQVLEHIQAQNFNSAIEILLDYYDKSYSESLKRRNQPMHYFAKL
jgi:tRNA 2-selenouridine synthase